MKPSFLVGKFSKTSRAGSGKVLEIVNCPPKAYGSYSMSLN